MAKRETHGSKYSVYLTIDGEEFYISTTQIEKLYFIEDIFSYSITGKIQFHDRQGILEFGPLTGNEKISVIYGINTDVEKTFDIFKINSVIPSWSDASGKENFIELVFVDENFYDLTNVEYSKSWKEAKYSDVVKDIASNMLEIDKFEEWEDSNEQMDYFYLPFWTPKEGIDWLMKRCSGKKFGKAGFLFYNNSEGTNFITLENLLQQSDLMLTEENGTYTFSSDLYFDFNKILAYRLSGIDNLSRKELKGGHRKGYDFKRKKFLDESFTYSDMIPEYTLLGKKSLFEDISEENTSQKNFGEDDKKIIENIYYNNWIKKYAMQQTLSIIVQGHEERYAGGMIEIEWPSAHDKEMYNKNWSGKYLVKSITHQFSTSNPNYQQKITLIKNAYEDSDNTNLIKAKSKNLGG